MNRKTGIRIFVFAILIVSTATMANARLDTEVNPFKAELEVPFENRPKSVETRANITVITTQGNKNPDNGVIVAFAPDGRVLYYNSTYDNYFDVDPSPRSQDSVMYVASRRLSPSACSGGECYMNRVERVNLQTGAVARIYSHVADDTWHDVDRIDEHRLVVADIAADQVFIINATSGLRTWTWDAQAQYNTSEGGLYPGDWTQINDVSYLNNEIIMASLRNFD